MRTSVAKRVREVSGVVEVARPIELHQVVANDPPTEAPPRYEDLSLVEQIRAAFRLRNWLAILIGVAVGFLAPVTGYQVVHREWDPAVGFWQWSTALAAAVLLFSAPKVYRAGVTMFGSSWQGLALVGILDGTMLWAKTGWLVVAALVVQCFFNATSVTARVALGVGKKNHPVR